VENFLGEVKPLALLLARFSLILPYNILSACLFREGLVPFVYSGGRVSAILK